MSARAGTLFEIIKSKRHFGMRFGEFVQRYLAYLHPFACAQIEPLRDRVQRDQRGEAFRRTLFIELLAVFPIGVYAAIEIVIEVNASGYLDVATTSGNLIAYVQQITIAALNQLNQQEQTLIRHDVVGNPQRISRANRSKSGGFCEHSPV